MTGDLGMHARMLFVFEGQVASVAFPQDIGHDLSHSAFDIRLPNILSISDARVQVAGRMPSYPPLLSSYTPAPAAAATVAQPNGNAGAATQRGGYSAPGERPESVRAARRLESNCVCGRG